MPSGVVRRTVIAGGVLMPTIAGRMSGGRGQTAAKGDPGGNVMAVGPFSGLSGLSIPVGTDLIQTSGPNAARYAATVNTGTTAWRRQTSNGRWFELAEDRPTLRMLGAMGDDATDDTAGWAAFVAYLMATGRTGSIPAGIYRLSSATAITMTGPLSIVGEPGAIMDGRVAAANVTTASVHLLKLTAHSVRITGVEFRSFSDLIFGGNNNEGSFGSTWTGDIAEIELHRCIFRGVRRPLTCRVTDAGPHLRSLVLTDNVIDGKLTPASATTGWSGFHVAVHQLDAATVTDNRIQNIDATAAGGSPPANIGNGRAILLGGNNPSDTFARRGWKVAHNDVRNITEGRARVRSTNPEVGAIRVTGAAYCDVSHNYIENVRSTHASATNDCEGIYLKAPLSIVAHNELIDAGYASEGSICIKGTVRSNVATTESYGWGVRVLNNILRTSLGDRATGIGIYTSHCIVEGNEIDGFGGDHANSRWCPIFVDANQMDETKVHRNTIRNAVGRFGIRFIGYGRNIEIVENTIDGVLGTVFGGVGGGVVYGIAVENVDANGTNTSDPPLPMQNLKLEGNRIGGLVSLGGGQRAISVINAASDMLNLAIRRNEILDDVSTGLYLDGEDFDFSRLTIEGNDLSKATHPVSRNGRAAFATRVVANGNRV